MKEKIIKLLKNNSSYISGQDISNELGITRASVWKYINALKKEGYIIEGISNKGYKLHDSSDILTPIEITSKLETITLGRKIQYFQKVTSTNIIAKDLANNKEIDGTLIISEIQTEGKGRLNRNWSSPKGGIWASLILRPNLEPIHAPKITLIAAAALTLTLKKYNLDVKIKWPNDLLLNKKKFCGILTEMNCDMDRINYIILGFGINVNVKKCDIPKEILHKTTSLLIYSGITFDRCNILCEFLKSFELLYNELLETSEIKTTLNICRKNSLIIGKNVILSSRTGDEKVTCIDITDTGALIVIDENHNERVVLSGDVSLTANYQNDYI